ncbi:MAG: hypothetical protein EBR20_04705 [Bacteroidetes bacterium]|nr:hypothetical protein [Bacteroidota bacterium]
MPGFPSVLPWIFSAALFLTDFIPLNTMQGNGFKIFLTAFFLVLSGYYMYPSAQKYFINQEMEAMTAEERQAFENDNVVRIRTIDEKALNLGLDLLGGMHVALEVRVDALVRELATDVDEAFEAVLTTAVEQSLSSTDGDFIQVFVDAFEARDADARLSRYFRNEAAGITRRSTNAEVASYLQTEAGEAVSRAMSIIRDRVDRYGVTEPSIQQQGSRRIIVELPGIDDPERIRGLLRGTARLEFRLMVDPAENVRALQRVIDFYEEDPDSTAAVEADTTFDVNELLAGDQGGSGNRLLDDGIRASRLRCGHLMCPDECDGESCRRCERRFLPAASRRPSSRLVAALSSCFVRSP